jgi:uncharacterized protein
LTDLTGGPTGADAPTDRGNAGRADDDAHGLLNLADPAISAGDTMNREAVALGSPCRRVSRAGLVRSTTPSSQGRLRRLEEPAQVRVEWPSKTGVERVRRDSRQLVKLLLSAAP